MIVGFFITYKQYDGFSHIFGLALNNENIDIQRHVRKITSLPDYTGASLIGFRLI